jgi:hypothetical protein
MVCSTELFGPNICSPMLVEGQNAYVERSANRVLKTVVTTNPKCRRCVPQPQLAQEHSTHLMWERGGTPCCTMHRRGRLPDLVCYFCRSCQTINDGSNNSSLLPTNSVGIRMVAKVYVCRSTTPCFQACKTVHTEQCSGCKGK